METLLELIALLCLGFWVLVHLHPRRRWPTGCRLSSPPAKAVGQASGSASPLVVAVVPARNEAETLPRTLPSLLSQDHSRFRVILVDDRSEDGTAEVAVTLAARLGREEVLHVVQAPPVPDGWVGKVHALATGAAGAEEILRAGGQGLPGWFLFTDADIRHRAGSLRSLLSKAMEGPYDLVSVMARLQARNFWERVLIPPFVFFFQAMYPFREVGKLGSRVSAAAGGCVLLSRALLERAGGLDSIKSALIDDMALAKTIRHSGGNLWLGLDPGVVSVRSYPGLAGIWRMVSRNAFVQLRYRYDLLVGVLLGLGVLFVAPPFLALALLVQASVSRGGSGGAALPWIALGGALLAWGLQALALLPSVRHHRVPAVFSLTFPLASLLYGLMTFSAAWNHLRGRATPWKGRSYTEGSGGART